jgi:dephospho-CoA kinase
LILGLTGGYCTGKSTAASILKTAGWTIVDVDALGHRALELQAHEVAALIGPATLKPDGSPDRRAIGRAVFSDPAMLEAFEAIVHPVMNTLVAGAVGKEAVTAAGGKVCVDAALLYRLPVAEHCDAIIEMRSPLLVRLGRARRRDGHGFRVFLDRIARQRPLKLVSARFAARIIVVHNIGSQSALERRIRKALDQAEFLATLN